MDPRYLSTGQAAKVCSVTADTILKWIRAGRLPSRRTAGGHHRIALHDLEKLVATSSAAARRPPHGAPPRQFRYCWEHKGGDQLLEGCRECVVYQLRAERCYELVKRAPELGHAQLFCQGSCEACDYYQQVLGQATNVLVITDDEDLAGSLERTPSPEGVRFQVVDCEYACSAAVGSFRPDFAVVDCHLGAEAVADITHHLSQDPRIPFVRIILAGSADGFPVDCDRVVFARIDRPFAAADLAACAAQARVGGRQ